jgi:hypothetical protein
MFGYKLDTQQRNELVGQQFAPTQYFNPVPNIEGVYFIFDGEVDNCVNEEFMWVKELPQAEYVPPTFDNPII